MSSPITTPTSPRPADPVAGPVPRRVRPPRWLDLRLVLGVLLVLGSVLLGARVVAPADATVPVWSATGDLAAGTVLTAADLVAVDVRLDGAAGAYLAAGTRPEGRTLARAVRAGELLPRASLEEPAELVQVALPVQAGYVPPGLVRGQVVDVYAVADPAVGATGPSDVSLVVGAAPVQAISGRAEGVLSTATTTVQVVVSVPAGRAPAVLGAIAGRPLVVVVHESVDAPSPDGAATVPTGAAAASGPAASAPGASAPARGTGVEGQPVAETPAGEPSPGQPDAATEPAP
ncbi:SAF domain-containing protein [Geodermatophilus sp. SYSU D01186]